MKLARIKSGRLLLIFISVMVLSQLIMFLLSIITFGRIGIIAKKSTNILVQLQDGTSVIATPLAAYKRSNANIKRVVTRTMTGLLSWKSVIEDSSSATPRFDPGVMTPKGKITTPAFESSLTISQDFSSQLTAQIAQLTPDNLFSGQNKTQSLLIIENLSTPEEIGKGRWKLNMVARLVIYQGGSSQPVEFNKTVFVQAVEPPILPKNPTKLQRQLYEARRDGIEIYYIKDLKL